MKTLLAGFLFLFLLAAAAKGQNKTPATQPALFFSFDGDTFSATGKWVPADPKEKPGFPSETQIDCFRSNTICVEATAEYYSGHPHITLSYLQIVKWDKDGIIAASSSGICMTNTVLISFADKSISETDSMKQLNEETKKACNFFGAEKTETSTLILRGSERWNKEHWATQK